MKQRIQGMISSPVRARTVAFHGSSGFRSWPMTVWLLLLVHNWQRMQKPAAMVRPLRRFPVFYAEILMMHWLYFEFILLEIYWVFDVIHSYLLSSLGSFWLVFLQIIFLPLSLPLILLGLPLCICSLTGILGSPHFSEIFFLSSSQTR